MKGRDDCMERIDGEDRDIGTVLKIADCDKIPEIGCVPHN